MKCLVFTTLDFANIAQYQICYNIICNNFDSMKLIDKNGVVIEILQDFKDLSDDDKKLCKELGKNASTNEWVYDKGFTTSFAIPKQIYDDTRYWFIKPSENYMMTNVKNYTEEEYSNSWNPPNI